MILARQDEHPEGTPSWDSSPFWFFGRSSEFASINSHKCIRGINSDFSEGGQEDLDPSRVTDVWNEDLGYGIWGNSPP